METTEFIKPANSLKRELKEARIVDAIAKRITAIPNFIKYKLDLEVLTMCCNICEHLAKMKNKKYPKFNKKKLVLDAITKAYGSLGDEERQALDKNIQYLWENGKIKVATLLEVWSACCFDWCKRRIL